MFKKFNQVFYLCQIYIEEWDKIWLNESSSGEYDILISKLFFWDRLRSSDSLIYNYFPTARDQGCCKRYSLGHGISSAVQEIPESLEINIPRLLRA